MKIEIKIEPDVKNDMYLAYDKNRPHINAKHKLSVKAFEIVMIKIITHGTTK